MKEALRILRAALRRAVFALAFVLPAATAQALEFNCIEPARYRNLLSIFNDDPAQFSSYFGLPREQQPDWNACRAMLVTGSLDVGDPVTLLDHIIKAKGWLAVLYLAFDSSNPAIEARLAMIIRNQGLKTRALPPTGTLNYMPDFALRWDRQVPLNGTNSAMPEPVAAASPLDAGMRAFQARRDLLIKPEKAAPACSRGCRTLWFAGVNRRIEFAGSGDTPATAPDDLAAQKLRVIVAYFNDLNRLPNANDEALKRPLGWMAVSPPIAGRLLRAKCGNEISVAESLEARFGEAFNAMAAASWRVRDIEGLGKQFEGLNRAGARLQQCLAGAIETERLTSFNRICGKSCDAKALAEPIEKRAEELLEQARKL